jgi:hypothetical protein
MPWATRKSPCRFESVGCHSDIFLFYVDNETDIERREEEDVDVVVGILFTP